MRNLRVGERESPSERERTLCCFSAFSTPSPLPPSSETKEGGGGGEEPSRVRITEELLGLALPSATGREREREKGTHSFSIIQTHIVQYVHTVYAHNSSLEGATKLKFAPFCSS